MGDWELGQMANNSEPEKFGKEDRGEAENTLRKAAQQACRTSSALMEEVLQIYKILPKMTSVELVEFRAGLLRLVTSNAEMLNSVDKIRTSGSPGKKPPFTTEEIAAMLRPVKSQDNDKDSDPNHR